MSVCHPMYESSLYIHDLTNRSSSLGKKREEGEREIKRKKERNVVCFEKSKLNMACSSSLNSSNFLFFFLFFFVDGYDSTWFNLHVYCFDEYLVSFVRCLLLRFGLWVVNRGRMTIGLVSCRGCGFDAGLFRFEMEWKCGAEV